MKNDYIMKAEYIMKVESYTIRDSILTLHFNKDFKQIRYVKMESDNLLHSDKTSDSLDCDEMEISYSKRRNCFNVCLSNNSDQVIILITQFDKRQTCYGYHIKRQNTLENTGDSNVKNTDQDLLTKGMISLLSGNFKVDKDQSKDGNIFSIKNQNIFAKIKKKSAKDGVATFM
jgi:hypothetical protein